MTLKRVIRKFIWRLKYFFGKWLQKKFARQSLGFVPPENWYDVTAGEAHAGLVNWLKLWRQVTLVLVVIKTFQRQSSWGYGGIQVARVVVTATVWHQLGDLDETPEREFRTQKDVSLLVETPDGNLLQVSDVEEAGWEAVLVDSVVRRVESRSGWDVLWIDALQLLFIVDVDRKRPPSAEVVKDNL